MREIKEKRRIKKIIFSKVVIVILVVLLFFIFSATMGVYGKYSETKQNRYAAEVVLLDLEMRETDLEREIDRLGTERGVEKDIRENFGFVKEGEEVVIILDDRSITNNNRNSSERGFFRALFGIIKSIFTLE